MEVQQHVTWWITLNQASVVNQMSFIIHAGTNDLTKEENTIINLQNIVDDVKSSSPKTEVVIGCFRKKTRSYIVRSVLGAASCFQT